MLKGKISNYVVGRKMTAQLYVIVLNWNSWRDTIECVRSLRLSSQRSHHIVVVDNASTDDSEQHIRREYPDITVIQSGANIGYAGGNNLGIKLGLDNGAKYILLINPDVRIDPRGLELLVNMAENDPAIAAMSPTIWTDDNPRALWYAGSSIDWNNGSVTHTEAALHDHKFVPCDWAAGCCMLLSAEAIRAVGLMIESYFLYFEEVDYCQKLMAKGYRVGVCSSALAFHSPSSITKQGSKNHQYYMTRNYLRFFWLFREGGFLAKSRIIYRILRRLALNRSTLVGMLHGDQVAAARVAGCLDFARRRHGKWM
ncbi:MAG: hypothetical protein JWO59_2143 [Chloroflexi bacterium]|nr:hypothetical protein [Chloroflexota bacterium]